MIWHESPGIRLCGPQIARHLCRLLEIMHDKTYFCQSRKGRIGQMHHKQARDHWFQY
jgi:hypothetical protein